MRGSHAASLMRARKAAIMDERKGAAEYRRMAARERKAGNSRNAAIYERHARDEDRHQAENKQILKRRY